VTSDQDQFAVFYAETSGSLWRYIRRSVRRPEIADELMQEAYVRLLAASAERMMTEDHRRHYLFRIATNLVTDYYRSSSREEERATVEMEAVGEEPHAITRQLVDKTLGQLRHQDRALLWLAYGEGASHREIASLTGYKAASVRPLLHQAKNRALDAVRRLLRQGAGGGEVK
jgi:RNA polymerase sigma-70 factor, ECF subfamily